jgi:tetraacyldisaccharide 4'-kinase
MIRNLRDWLRDRYFAKPSEGLSLGQWLLVPLVPVYRGARRINQLWRTLNRRNLDRPVVSVGNISVGGTGKTALVSWLVDRLSEEDLSPAVLKRGEGTGDAGTIEPGSTVDPRRYGDEVALLREAHPDLPIGVGTDRFRGARAVSVRFDVDLFILDDGFQHRQLARNMDVVLLGDLDECGRWQLPAGPLREPPGALERADVVSLKGTEGADRLREELRAAGVNVREDQVLMNHYYQFDSITRNGETRTDRYRDGPVHLLSTQARPDRLKQFLVENGFDVTNHLALADHESVNEERIREQLELDKLVVTDKEWVKLPDSIRDRVGRIHSELVVSEEDRFIREMKALVEAETR